MSFWVWLLFVARDLLAEYKKLKGAGAFEVRRPKSTKEIALHNNQLLQQLPAQIFGGWSEAMRQQPAAPRPTAEEVEQLASQQMDDLLRKVAELEKRGVGECAWVACLLACWLACLLVCRPACLPACLPACCLG